MAPMIFFKFSGYIFLSYFIKNPVTTIALTFLTYIISAIDGVKAKGFESKLVMYDDTLYTLAIYSEHLY